MRSELKRLKVALRAGQPVPPDIAERVLDWIAESPVVLEERNRLIAYHAQRLGPRLYTGCQRLLVKLDAGDPSVADLADLGCPVPELRQCYRIASKLIADMRDSFEH